MQNSVGIIVALILGALGTILNWLYLSGKAKSLETQSFLAISSTNEIGAGTEFKPEHFMEVKIPKIHAQGLDSTAFLYEDLPTIVGTKAVKSYQAGDILLRQDVRTPPLDFELAPNETTLTITVTRISLGIKPGDQISFFFPTSAPVTGTNSDENQIGPFKIAAIGNQIGSSEVAKAYRLQQTQSNQLTIICRMEGGKIETRAQELLKRVSENPRDVYVFEHNSN